MNKTLLSRIFLFTFIAVTFYVTYLQLKSIKPFEIQKLLPEGHVQRVLYEDFNKKYDDENKIFALIKNKKEFSPTTLFLLLKQIEKTLKFKKGINSQASLINAKYIEFDGKKFQLTPFLEKNYWNQNAKNKLETDFWKNTLISTDFKETLITFSLSKKLPRKKRVPLVNEVMHAISDITQTNKDLSTFYLGTEVANSWFTKEMLRNQMIITPLIFFIIGLFFYIVFKSLKVSFVSLLTILIGYALTILLITILEDGIGPYSSFALFFVLIISTADLIHFFTAFQKYQNIEQTIQNIYYPCLLTSITTAIGFSALLFNENIPIRFFGLYCAAGTFICYFLTFLLLPLLIEALGINKIQKDKKDLSRIYQICCHYIVSKRKRIIFFFGVITVIFLHQSLSLKIDDNLYRKFISSHPLSSAVDEFSKEFNFVGSVDLLLTSNDGSAIKSEKKLKIISQIEKDIQNHKVFSHFQSMTQLQKNIKNELEEATNNKDLLNSFLGMLEDYGGLTTFYKRNQNEMRTIIFLKSLNSSDLESYLKFIQEINKKYKSIELRASGFSAIRNYINQNIIKDFIISFSYSLLIIFIIFLFVFRSFKWSIYGIIPNIFPLLTISGLMGIFNITMESNLIILVSITIGIAVDDTIHFIVTFRRELTNSSGRIALTKTYQKTFKALLSTTLIYVFCFPVFLLADLKLFMQMGAFLLLSFIAALLADFFLLPALIFGEKNDNI